MTDIDRDLASRYADRPGRHPDAARRTGDKSVANRHLDREQLVALAELLEAEVDRLRRELKYEQGRRDVARGYLKTYGPLPHKGTCIGEHHGEKGCACGAGYVDRLFQEDEK